MPENSAKILFESLLGVKLRAYRSYDDVYETLSALRCNEIQGAWFADITADYLLKTEGGFQRIDVPETTKPRVQFAMAVKKGNEKLQTELNTALTNIKENGVLEQLIGSYIENADTMEPFYPKDMKIANAKKSLTIGVTGAVWPIDMIDMEGKPYGFSVAFMNEIGKLLERDIRFVCLSNDTAFSSLMGGKVDALFCYGTSESTLTDNKNYIMTDGYVTMNQYSYLVLE